MSKKLNIMLIGASGRMGRAIKAAAHANKFKIIYEINSESKWPEEIRKIDCVIDFSFPNVFKDTKKWLEKNKLPYVNGVTGLNNNDLKAIKLLGKKMPVLYSPNMSMGIALLKRALTVISTPKNFNITVTEIHHSLKKDKPSGTAKLIVDGLGKHSLQVVRGGEVVGIHRVQFSNENEIFTLEHRALNRQLFAEGALAAARWLTSKKKGFYQLDDIMRS